MSILQPTLLTLEATARPLSYRENLIALLGGELDFHDADSSYASHNFHAFPAKFPPQLPRKFIAALTQPGEKVLDPMMGSGTTLLEARLAGRAAFGCDIDPLALMLTQVKLTAMEKRTVSDCHYHLATRAQAWISQNPDQVRQSLDQRWDAATRKFVDYWFAAETQLELMALLHEIEQITDPGLQAFFKLAFSATIITKSGGVSLAFDLAHTRPHRVKVVRSASGEILMGADVLATLSESQHRYHVKTLRSPLEEFNKRVQANLKGLTELHDLDAPYTLARGNAQALPLPAEAIDLIVTSPPYASNAIDYMRAHKFSLVWLGHPINHLGEKRKTYIGGENISDFAFVNLPPHAAQIVDEIRRLDAPKGAAIHRYYSEMTHALREMYRVLKPGKAALVVVGTSVMRGIDTQTQHCLAEIGQTLGFEVPAIGVRRLDRDRRMMPAGFKVDRQSQIQQRMHEEYVIGLYKPDITAKETR
ncbi:MAG TPA: DNA methyltransferase [Anaerolineae bacterium]|nr:DNA methyltransferase [Anaerolineae bacterium]